MQYQQSLRKNFISLKHPNANSIKRYSFHKKIQPLSKILKFTQIQIQIILKYLTLSEILNFYMAVHTDKHAKEIQKNIINYLIKTNRTFSYSQQKQFMQMILARRKKAKNHYKSSKISWFRQIINQDVERTSSQKNITLRQIQIMKGYLNNVLCSLSNVYFRIGYIQGFNFIVKNMYQNQYSQVQAFNYTSYFLSQMNVEELYLYEMRRVHQLCYVLEVYIYNYIPKVYQFLKKTQVATQLYASSWFITLFSQSLPLKTVNKIWNLFLIKGYKILVKFGIAVIWAFQTQILKAEQIYIFMRKIMQKITKKKQEIVWQIMSSLKITNKMIATLAKQMQIVQKDSQIQIWKLQSKNMKQSMIVSSTDGLKCINEPNFLSTSMCYQGSSTPKINIFNLCTNTQHT